MTVCTPQEQAYHAALDDRWAAQGVAQNALYAQNLKAVQTWQSNQRRSNLKIKLAFLSYCVMGFMSFAHVYDSFPATPNPDQVMGAFLAGTFWPIYVGGKTALTLVRAAKTTSVCQ